MLFAGDAIVAGDVVVVTGGEYNGKKGVVDSVIPFKTCRLEIEGLKYGTTMVTEDIPLDKVAKLVEYETTVKPDREFMQPADSQPGMFWANKFKYTIQFGTVGKLFRDYYWPFKNARYPWGVNPPEDYTPDNRDRVVRAGEARARDREEEVKKRPKPVELEVVEDFENKVRDGFYEQQAISIKKPEPPEPPKLKKTPSASEERIAAAGGGPYGAASMHSSSRIVTSYGGGGGSSVQGAAPPIDARAWESAHGPPMLTRKSSSFSTYTLTPQTLEQSRTLLPPKKDPTSMTAQATTAQGAAPNSKQPADSASYEYEYYDVEPKPKSQPTSGSYEYEYYEVRE